MHTVNSPPPSISLIFYSKNRFRRFLPCPGNHFQWFLCVLNKCVSFFFLKLKFFATNLWPLDTSFVGNFPNSKRCPYCFCLRVFSFNLVVCRVAIEGNIVPKLPCYQLIFFSSTQNLFSKIQNSRWFLISWWKGDILGEFTADLKKLFSLTTNKFSHA